MSRCSNIIPDSLLSDPIMKRLVQSFSIEPIAITESVDLFAEVVRAIIRQQLSVKAAPAIEGRFISLLPEGSIEPDHILTLDKNKLRECGISHAKVKYITSAAVAAKDGTVDFSALADKSNDQVIDELIQIHGVGQWTAEMILIFNLGRPDIFSLGDLGLRNAISRLYGVDRNDLDSIASISKKWSPHRSLASRYLWKSLNNTPT